MENELEDDVEVVVLLDVVETDVTGDVGCSCQGVRGGRQVGQGWE